MSACPLPTAQNVGAQSIPGTPPREVTAETLRQHLHLPAKEAAKEFGMCLSTLKKFCRKHGVKRWPSRKVKMLDRKIESLAGSTSTGSSNASEDRAELRRKLQALERERAALPSAVLNSVDSIPCSPASCASTAVGGDSFPPEDMFVSANLSSTTPSPTEGLATPPQQSTSWEGAAGAGAETPFGKPPAKLAHSGAPPQGGGAAVKVPTAKRALAKAAGEGKVKVKVVKVKVMKVKVAKVAGEAKVKVVKVKKEKKEKKEKEAGDKVKAPRKKRAPKAGVASTDDDLALIRALAGCAGGAAPEDDAMDTDMQLLAAALAGEASAADSHDEWLPSGGGEAGDNNLAAALRECAEEDADEEEGDTGDELADPFYHYALDPAGDMLGMFEN
ncbi:RWP-RK domain-containing protein [Baffinella frigidus]|nr:RWP-RK domain-containing protein [Cryptophyta sp. CCMP2293]